MGNNGLELSSSQDMKAYIEDYASKKYQSFILIIN